MNRMHALAKIMLCGIGIFFAIRFTSGMVTMTWMAIAKPSKLSILIPLFWTVIIASCLAVVLYVFLYKREELAKKIVGANELPEPESQIQWLPVAFRLVCIAAGMYCLHIVLWNMTYTLTKYFSFKLGAAQSGYKVLHTAKIVTIEEILIWLITLAVGIYLVCGAPRFVRWQVKKTLEQCKQQAETKKNQ